MGADEKGDFGRGQHILGNGESTGGIRSREVKE